uniref:Secreted protein n=1 Tax=Engystomops pustulosus TaxID=76066 RepID=A0AAV6YGX9_ENGPU|nr:hypothetical protein GDO81_026385 [Engystomops pustulosus]
MLVAAGLLYGFIFQDCSFSPSTGGVSSHCCTLCSLQPVFSIVPGEMCNQTFVYVFSRSRTMIHGFIFHTTNVTAEERRLMDRAQSTAVCGYALNALGNATILKFKYITALLLLTTYTKV